ncbi:MAG: hypothetical protein PHG19_10155 [Anaerotignum sp.]|nr:hypothetical protein [Anaerotignum sp.]
MAECILEQLSMEDGKNCMLTDMLVQPGIVLKLHKQMLDGLNQSSVMDIIKG